MSELKEVFHVEDDPDIRQITMMALQVLGGMNVTQYEDGPTALKGAGDHAPDLLLLDQMMPGLTGAETLEQLRKLPAYRNIPAVFMTAQTDMSSEELMKKTDSIAVIPKPFDPMTLADQLRRIWGENA